MAIQWSTTVRNARLNAIPAAIGSAAIIRLFGGSLPASCAVAITSQPLLVEFDLASTWMTSPTTGSIALSNTPLSATGASTAGTGINATFYRIYSSDGVTCHEQGTVTGPTGSGDMILDNVNIANGQNVTISSFSKTEPGA